MSARHSPLPSANFLLLHAAAAWRGERPRDAFAHQQDGSGRDMTDHGRLDATPSKRFARYKTLKFDEHVHELAPGRALLRRLRSRAGGVDTSSNLALTSHRRRAKINGLLRALSAPARQKPKLS